MNRRNFLKKSLLTGIGLAGLSSVYACLIEPYNLEFVKLKMGIRNLPKTLVGKTLMQISDIHVGNRFDPKFLIKSFEKAKLLNPDIVVYTGDFVSYENKDQLEQLQQVMTSAVHGKLASVAILGNHDYGRNWAETEVADEICSILKQKEILVLRNEIIEIEGLNIIGLDDLWGQNFDPKKATSKINLESANIVLCHNPDVCDLAVWNGYNGWILSGHTHGGQVRIPFLGAPLLPVKNKRYDAGKIDLKDGRTLYINRALGHRYPIRFLTRPEITMFEMQLY